MEEVIHPVEEVIHTLVILESAQGPNPSFFLFIRLLFNLGACWDQDLDQGSAIKHDEVRWKYLLTVGE